MNKAVKHSIINTNPGKSKSNSPVSGIGHLSHFGDYLIINNIDHNTEFSIEEGIRLKPIAVYDQSIYSKDVENQGFDLDIHAVLYDANRQSLLMLNHFGRVRFFDEQLLVDKGSPKNISACREALWLGDVEQTLLIDDCLVSTSPGDYHVNNSSMPGLFISSPLANINYKKSLTNLQTIEYVVYFADKGYVSAIAANNMGNMLAVAFGQEVIIFSLNAQRNNALTLGDMVAQFKVQFYTRFLSFWSTNNLLAAGHDSQFEDNVYDPSNLRGGGFVTMNIPNKQILSEIPFNCDLAWGNGGLCLSIGEENKTGIMTETAKMGTQDMIIIGVDRQANLLAWHWKEDQKKYLFSNESTSVDTSYGIGHLCWHKGELFCGFNRDGSRLHKYGY